MTAGETRVARSGAWQRRGREHIYVGSSASRAGLVSGTYIPGLTVPLADSVGVVNWGELVDVGNGVQTANIPSSTTYLENRRYKQCVNVSSGTSDLGFYNCHFVGNNQQQVFEQGSGTVNSRSFINFTGRHVTFTDCTFDQGWWYDQGLSNRVSTASSFSFHGGNFSFIRCHFRRSTDKINYAGRPCGNAAWNLIDACRFAEAWFGPSGQLGGYTHADDVQWNTGSQPFEIRHSYFGGDFQGSLTPGEPGVVTASSYNAIFMIQQERDSGFEYTSNWLVDDYYIHDNWVHGSGASFNVNNYVTTDWRYNTMPGDSTSGCRIVRNKIAVRDGTVNKAGTDIRRTTSVETYFGAGTADQNVRWDPTAGLAGINGTGQAAVIVTAADEYDAAHQK